VVALGAGAAFAASAWAQSLAAFTVVGDAIPAPLAASPGDPTRGRAIALDRALGGCVLCHVVPEAPERSAGDLGPRLAGVASRLTVGQLRLRVVDPTRVNPDTPMPAYYRIEGLRQVSAAYRGRPILTAEQVEDVVAWLATLGERQ
jgi:sulfur-oxidizing protein SoxX